MNEWYHIDGIVENDSVNTVITCQELNRIQREYRLYRRDNEETSQTSRFNELVRQQNNNESENNSENNSENESENELENDSENDSENNEENEQEIFKRQSKKRGRFRKHPLSDPVILRCFCGRSCINNESTSSNNSNQYGCPSRIQYLMGRFRNNPTADSIQDFNNSPSIFNNNM